MTETPPPPLNKKPDATPVTTDVIRLAVRCVCALCVIGGLIFLMQSEHASQTENGAVTAPPKADRLPLDGAMGRDRDSLDRKAHEARLAQLAVQLRKKATEAQTLSELPSPKELSLLPEDLRQTILPLIKNAETRFAEAARKKQEAAEAQKAQELAKQQTEEQRRAAADEARKKEEARRTAAQQPITKPVKDAYIVVYLSRRYMGICVGKKYLRSYRDIAVAKDIEAPKEAAGDRRSPVGNYYICAKEAGARGRVLQISYPAPQDATRALQQGDIDTETAAAIKNAHTTRTVPPQDTALGGGIYITATRTSDEFTDGGFAVTPDAFEELWNASVAGRTWVVIRP